MDGKRVVLVEPGDVLLLSNLGESLTGGAANLAYSMAHDFGIKVVMFTGPVDMDVLKKADRA